MKPCVNTALDPTLRSTDAQNFEVSLRRKIVGQDPAIEKVAEIYQVFLAGLNAPNCPIGHFLFLGPTGSGKTRVEEAMVQATSCESLPVVKVDCPEFHHSLHI